MFTNSRVPTKIWRNKLKTKFWEYIHLKTIQTKRKRVWMLLLVRNTTTIAHRPHNSNEAAFSIELSETQLLTWTELLITTSNEFYTTAIKGLSDFSFGIILPAYNMLWNNKLEWKWYQLHPFCVNLPGNVTRQSQLTPVLCLTNKMTRGRLCTRWSLKIPHIFNHPTARWISIILVSY